MHNIVYLTCELKNRDLDSRLLIAAHLIKAGFFAVVGRQWGMFENHATAPTGCFLFKTSNQIMSNGMEVCRKVGHVVVAMDEEALPLRGQIALENLAAKAAANAHVFLAQNEDHRALLATAYPDWPMHVVGNPRLDVLAMMLPKFQAEAQEIRRTTGDYILFNTNFAIGNSVIGSAQDAIDAMYISMRTKDNKEKLQVQIQQRIDAEVASRGILVDIMHRCIQQFPNHRIVVRPHPAEKIETWTTFAATTNGRVLVAPNTAAVPWMIGAHTTIHADSTTGLEAALAGAPCINVGPLPQWSDNFIMHKVNPTVRTADEAMTLLSGPPQARMTNTAYVDHLFPKDAAKNTAAKIVETCMKQSPRKLENINWVPMANVDPRLEAKFTVSRDEFMERAGAICATVGVGKIGVHQVDNSIFILGQGL